MWYGPLIKIQGFSSILTLNPILEFLRPFPHFPWPHPFKDGITMVLIILEWENIRMGYQSNGITIKKTDQGPRPKV